MHEQVELRNEHPYRHVLQASQRVAWRIEDVLPDDARFDVTRPMLPVALSGVDAVDALDASTRLALDHVRASSYLRLFGLVEEFILPFVLDHVRDRLGADDDEIRALLQFAGEEAKHIQLFDRFADRFARDVGVTCDVIGPASEIADAVLAHDALGVALVILHVEWMTQRHYVESVQGETRLEPLFASLLRQHWLEEAQHARLDAMIVDTLAARLSPSDVRRGIDDYRRICAVLEDGLCAQVELDLVSLERMTGRELSRDVRTQLRDAQRASYRTTFLESGATHPAFRRSLDALSKR
ncbi:diiron oxygenase [Sandaracinus amylolyticus]|uniref:diiron oxygenase n=1 Tax=Sandaracinus amylolyticus TaxID=927083 RepID=UPI001F2D6183|nr:diiron oxygenase [Sandaracinus amylolyticus]UJR84075.1 Hypothetical protein I5071_61460 [Sandaracinus amylolyticus]